MSAQLISRSPDLQRLRDEGFGVQVQSNYLVVTGVPYVTEDQAVAYGSLISELSTSGDSTTTPSTHEIYFVGTIPYDHQGNELTRIINQRGPIQLAHDLVACCSFSRKPSAGYPDYYEKVTAYVGMLENYARAKDDTVTARTYPPVPTPHDESVFRYLDSATSRARITAVTEKLELSKVVIIGLGGTGSYILDLVAKTPVREIDLYDGDKFFTHNAFRSPGAASLDELRTGSFKVEYFASKYGAMRRGIVAHAEHVTASNVDQVRDASFVFVAIDSGPTKKFILERLEEFDVPFVDTGLDIYQAGTALGGLLRTTTSINGQRGHVQRRVSFARGDGGDYARNIQIADLNMLTAALAVLKWKKLFGFYADFENELTSIYTIDGNHLLNEDRVA